MWVPLARETQVLWRLHERALHFLAVVTVYWMGAARNRRQGGEAKRRRPHTAVARRGGKWVTSASLHGRHSRLWRPWSMGGVPLPPPSAAAAVDMAPR